MRGIQNCTLWGPSLLSNVPVSIDLLSAERPTSPVHEDRLRQAYDYARYVTSHSRDNYNWIQLARRRSRADPAAGAEESTRWAVWESSHPILIGWTVRASSHLFQLGEQSEKAHINWVKNLRQFLSLNWVKKLTKLPSLKMGAGIWDSSQFWGVPWSLTDPLRLTKCWNPVTD